MRSSKILAMGCVNLWCYWTGPKLLSAPDHKQLAIYIFKYTRNETEEKGQNDVYKWHGEICVLNALPWLRGDLLFLYWSIFLAIWSRRKWLSTSVGGGLGQNLSAKEATPAARHPTNLSCLVFVV